MASRSVARAPSGESAYEPFVAVSSTLHNVRVVDKSHTYIMYSPVAINDARGLAATPYRLFGARRPVARVCDPPGSPPQRWSIHTGAVSRQCSSAGFSHAVKKTEAARSRASPCA